MLPSHCIDLSSMSLFIFVLCRIRQFQMCTHSMHTMLLLLFMLQVDFTLHQRVREALVSKVMLTQYLLNTVFAMLFVTCSGLVSSTFQGKFNPQFNEYQVENKLVAMVHARLFSLVLAVLGTTFSKVVCSCRLTAPQIQPYFAEKKRNT